MFEQHVGIHHQAEDAPVIAIGHEYGGSAHQTGATLAQWQGASQNRAFFDDGLLYFDPLFWDFGVVQAQCAFIACQWVNVADAVARCQGNVFQVWMGVVQHLERHLNGGV